MLMTRHSPWQWSAQVCQSYATKAKQLEAMINPACDALLKKVHLRHGVPHAAHASVPLCVLWFDIRH